MLFQASLIKYLFEKLRGFIQRFECFWCDFTNTSPAELEINLDGIIQNRAKSRSCGSCGVWQDRHSDFPICSNTCNNILVGKFTRGAQKKWVPFNKCIFFVRIFLQTILTENHIQMDTNQINLPPYFFVNQRIIWLVMTQFSQSWNN